MRLRGAGVGPGAIGVVFAWIRRLGVLRISNAPRIMVRYAIDVAVMVSGARE